jgi:hypothetical protein
MRTSTGCRVAGLVLGVVLAAAGCSGGSHGATSDSSRLNGLFRIAPGVCTDGTGLPTGSYLIVLSAATNHAVKNPHGGCKNPGYTLLRPGTDGGLITGEFQDVSGATFDSNANSRADRIIAPTRFGRFSFGFATNPRDEQDAATGNVAFPRPQAIVSGTALRVDLRSLVVSYAGNANTTCATSFGVGCWELGSENASGTYDAATGHFTLQWFTGESFTPKGDSIEVHLAGTFVPSST